MIKTIILWIAAHHLTAAAAAISLAVCISISEILLCYCHCGEWNSNCLPNHFMRTTIPRHTHTHTHSCTYIMSKSCHAKRIQAIVYDAFPFQSFRVRNSLEHIYACECQYQMHFSNTHKLFTAAIRFDIFILSCSLPAYRMDRHNIHTANSIYIKWFYVSVCRSAFVVPHHLINKLSWSIIRKIRIMTVRSIIRLGMVAFALRRSLYSILEWIQIYTMQLHVLIVIYHVHRQQ